MKCVTGWTAVVMCLAVALVGGAACRAQGERSRQWRIIVNDDGTAAAEEGITTIDDFVTKRWEGITGTQIGAFFTCVWSTDRLRTEGADLLSAGIRRMYPTIDEDELTRLRIARCHTASIEIFASVRMNDIHDAWAPKLTYPLKLQRPDLLLAAKRAYPEDALMNAFWSGFDYGKEEVHQHVVDFISSYCRQYDYDGVELDYFRHPLFFKLGEEEGNLDTMSRLVRQVRGLLNQIGRERGRPYLLAIRVPDTPETARRTGLDVEQWLKEGLLDMLVIGGGYMPYGARLKEFIDLSHQYGVPAYPCINHFQDAVTMHSLASNFRALGSDGIYIFNFAGVLPGSEEQQCLNQIHDPEALLGADKQYKADDGCSIFYCGHANPPPQFPVRLIDGTSIELVVGDDVQSAVQQGMLEEMRLQVKVANVDESEGITIKINGVRLAPASIERPDAETFAAVVAAPPIQRGINHIVVLPGLNSIGRLSSQVTGLELSVRYRHE